MAIAHRGVERGRDAAGAELQDLELPLAGKAGERGGAQVGHAVEVAVYPRLDLGLAGNHIAAHLGGTGDPGALVLDRGLVKDQRREEQHAGVAARHGKALVVRARDEQRESALVVLGLLGEPALGSAGHVEVEKVLGDLPHALIGGHALGAVAAAGKGHHDRGVLGTHVVEGGAHHVGRGHGRKLEGFVVTNAAQVRYERVAHVRRGSGTAEDHAGAAGATKRTCLGEKFLDCRQIVLVDLERALPQVRLLHDLLGGDLRAHRRERCLVHLEHVLLLPGAFPSPDSVKPCI